jgi:type II secretory pathway pseudopilin PulG
MSRRRKGQESGFALLFVLVAAAIIALMLYAELPRVAFEGQRIKEGDLIAHGEQYKRAIKLYVQRFNRYPPSIDALENTNNIRFLRRRFKDPMTGKDDWRLIHAGAGGFTDSLTMKPPKPAGTTDASQMASSSSGGDSGQPQAPPRWQLRRPSDGPAPEIGSGNPDAQAGSYQTDSSQQQAAPGAPVPMPGEPVYVAGQQQPGDAGVPGTTPPSALQPGDPGYQPMQPGRRPFPPGGQAFGTPNQPLYPPVPLPGMPSGGVGNQFGGPTATGSDQSSGSSSASFSPSSGLTSSGGGIGMTTAGAGIAGVASKYEATGIKTYKDHSKYNEWEFLYDPRQDMVGLAGAQAQPGPGGTALGTPLGTPLGTQPGGQPGTSQFGTQPGTPGP